MINVAPKLLKKTDFGTGLMSESPFFQHIPTQYHDVLTKFQSLLNFWSKL